MAALESLEVPDKPELTASLGRLAMAHTHLELMLRYTFKTLSRLSVKKALDATSGDRTSDVRKKIKKLFKDCGATELEKARLDALLGASKRLSEQRNEFLHSAWSKTSAGEAVIKGDDYQWKPAPSDEQVNNVTTEILELVESLNQARLYGFISEVIERHKNAANN
jgi:hypothetical protein